MGDRPPRPKRPKQRRQSGGERGGDRSPRPLVAKMSHVDRFSSSSAEEGGEGTTAKRSRRDSAAELNRSSDKGSPIKIPLRPKTHPAPNTADLVAASDNDSSSDSDSRAARDVTSGNQAATSNAGSASASKGERKRRRSGNNKRPESSESEDDDEEEGEPPTKKSNGEAEGLAFGSIHSVCFL